MLPSLCENAAEAVPSTPHLHLTTLWLCPTHCSSAWIRVLQGSVSYRDPCPPWIRVLQGSVSSPDPCPTGMQRREYTLNLYTHTYHIKQTGSGLGLTRCPDPGRMPVLILITNKSAEETRERTPPHLVCRGEQRGPPAPRDRLDVGSGAEQQFSHFHVPAGRGDIQGGPPALVRRLHVGPGRQEQLHDRHVAVAGGGDEGGPMFRV